MRRLISIFLAIFMVVEASAMVFAEDLNLYDKDEYLSTPYGVSTYDRIEQDVCAVEESVNRRYAEKLDKALAEGNEALYSNTYNQMRSERQAAVLEVYSNYGFVEIPNNSDGVAPLSASSDLTFSETLYFNSSASSYIYTVDWEWEFGAWDDMYDIDDIAGVAITNSDDYYINKSFAKTWNNGGGLTGYVDDTGNHTPSDSKITKRFEDAQGVAFNVTDTTNFNSAPKAAAHEGRITIHVKKKSGVSGTPECKIIGSYEHNYKTFALYVTAEVESVGFDLSGKLSVSYATVNKRWLRASGGKVIDASV